MDELFHEGERALQALTGESDMAARNARCLSDRIVPGAVKLIAAQPMLVAASEDADRSMWASVVFGEPGFVKAEPRAVHIDLTRLCDPLRQHLDAHAARIGLLFIEPASRRRYRVNGRVSGIGDAAITIAVAEAYPNCPKYIHRRDVVPPPTPTRMQRAAALDESMRAFIARADTFFVASGHPARELDASHRGGPPGFVSVLDAHTLRIPDYDGNSMFNTLGNLAVHPAVGLTFVDFEGGAQLQLTGRARIEHDVDDPDDVTGGTRRFWEVDIERVVFADDQ